MAAIKIVPFSTKTRADFLANGIHHDTWTKKSG